jgi:hypothetical protein
MTGPDLVPVESSAVEAVGYDAEGHELWIRYTGGAVYAYLDVPEEAHRALFEAESIGAFVNVEVKPNYRYRRP